VSIGFTISRNRLRTYMSPSRRYLQPNTVCYLCCRPILPGEDWNRDHIPPSRFFGNAVKRTTKLQLQWLPTHIKCNSDYKRDEELFALNAGFMGSASGSEGADALLSDIRRGLLKGQGAGLFLSIGPQFRELGQPDGTIGFSYDGERTLRIVWKIVRGLYTLDMGHPLSDDTPHFCYPLIAPWKAQEEILKIEWLLDLRGESMGRYKSVLDYKWIGFVDPEQPALRVHGLALLFWDRVIAPVLIHDPTCRCRQCSRNGKAC